MVGLRLRHIAASPQWSAHRNLVQFGRTDHRPAANGVHVQRIRSGKLFFEQLAKLSQLGMVWLF
jgi:hypothetical protein